MASLFNPIAYNSTTYVDQLSILLGLYQDRLPGNTAAQQLGESASEFLRSLYQAASERRDHTIEGFINDVAAHLGLSVQPGVLITSPDPSLVITVSAGQIIFVYGIHTVTIPTVTIDPDDFWKWRMLSDVVSDINDQTICSATLQIPDTYAIQLVPQSSLGCSVGESITNASSILNHSGIVVGSELFNLPVPTYTLTSSGNLNLSAAPTVGTQISYIYNLSPFILTCSQVSVISLKDPSLQTTALCPDGSMVYQVREFVYQILAQDPSYWGN